MHCDFVEHASYERIEAKQRVDDVIIVVDCFRLLVRMFSPQKQLLIFTNKKLEATRQRDFRKAFDSVSHNGLLKKLNSIGTTGKL